MHDRDKTNENEQEEAMEVDEIGHISDDEDGGVRIGDIYIPAAPKPALTMETTGPRLIITHIVNENFKSYAGKQVLGPFHKSFTSIIGPNGSGKSNVIDSMLFVFGYRATKIRSKKISVLIHSSSKHQNINSATVHVHFVQIIDEEGDSYTTVPNSEIVVSRTVYRDNTSFYTLNGRRVQFKEVANMLRSYNIDLDHNRFLILQGEVEQIAMMKPKGQTEHDTGMLEYLEDLIGTSRYKEPIEKLNVRVEELSEARKEKLNRVRLVENEKQKLEGPMREAVDTLNMCNSYVRARNTLLQKYIHETNKIIASKNEELDALKSGLKSIDDRLAETRRVLDEKQTELKHGNQKYVELEKKKEELSERLQQNKKKSVSCQSDITQCNKKKNNLEELIKSEKSKLIELEMVPEKNKKEISECEELLVKLDKDKTKREDELQTVMASVRSKTLQLQDKKDTLQLQLIELKRALDESTNKYKLAQSELKIYLSGETSEAEKLNNLELTLENAVTGVQEKRDELKEIETSLPDQKSQLTESQKQYERLKGNESVIVDEMRQLRVYLEEAKQAMSANRSKGRVLDSLMKEKKCGRIPGIFGRLGDLGAIDNKYDVAISTCCGALDNIVVDTIDTAQQCIEYLRSNNIGRGTFIALDKQNHLTDASHRKLNTPEEVPRLFDLIKVKDDRVLTAFYYALRDTLVASDLEQATRIAYGRTRYRVVTLKGDVIEMAGTMSGGGKTVMRGRMSSKVQTDTSIDDKLRQQKEERLTELEQSLSDLRREQNSLEEQIRSLSKLVNTAGLRMNKLRVEIKSLDEQIPLLKRQICDQEKRANESKVDVKHKKKLQDKIDTAEVQVQSDREAAGEVERQVKDIDREISSIAGVKDLHRALSDVVSRIDKVKSQVTKLTVAINTSVRNAKKSGDKISQMETDLQETQVKLESLHEQKKQLTLDIAKLQKELEEIEEQISEGSDEFAELKREIVKLQSDENKIKSERLEQSNEVNALSKTIEGFTSKVPVWDRELKSLKIEDPCIEGIPGVERPAPLDTHTAEELDGFSVDQLRQKLQAHKQRVGDNRPNMQAIQDYKTKEEMFIKRAAELDEITTRRNEMRTLYEQLRKKRTTEFLAGFNTITAKLKEMYQMITLGGDAELELVDSLDPFTEGIVFSVRPPNKSWKNISNLSGGEKTLSSLALVFALHYYRPTPLYVMDEIDAALDFKNVSIVANYIKERTKNAQFIIISLRYNMFEVSNRLVGIYKTDDCTKSLSIENTTNLSHITADC